jgi:hypothetical protein
MLAHEVLGESIEHIARRTIALDDHAGSRKCVRNCDLNGIAYHVDMDRDSMTDCREIRLDTRHQIIIN